jgi:hypothetical protein
MAFLALFLIYFTAGAEAAPRATAWACDSLYRAVWPAVNPQAPNLSALELRALTHNFFLTQQTLKANGGETINKWNEVLLAEFEKIPFTARLANRKAGLNREEIRRLYDRVSNHPVAAQCHLHKYDKDGRMGYCFGRATAAHLEAIEAKVQKESIRKIWAVGPMKTGSTNWQYHVTTLVRDDQGVWQAIDPIMWRPIPLQQWVTKMKSFSTDSSLTFFVTDPKRGFPHFGGRYRPDHFRGDQADPFFRDLMEESRKSE